MNIILESIAWDINLDFAVYLLVDNTTFWKVATGGLGKPLRR